MNWACPKDNFPTPFINQIIDACARHEVFSFMDGFFGYNQIQIRKEDRYKNAFITPSGTLSYQVIPFGLKNVGATFQWAMTLSISYWYTWMTLPLTHGSVHNT